MKMRICLLTLFVIFVILGCTSKRGIIELHTRPSEAAIYLDDSKQGMSPLKFEYNFSQPATLKIERQNYYTDDSGTKYQGMESDYHPQLTKKGRRNKVPRRKRTGY
ncbi:MAG: hypothetical protein JRJ39_17435 [Deltaproteobacteria bacterium]|nr:hypothetical protein [Deltaproteobacteria bacterium]